MKRRAKFSRGQIVVHREDGEPAKIERVRPFEKTYEYLCTGWRFWQEESDLRPQTARERGGKRRG